MSATITASLKATFTDNCADLRMAPGEVGCDAYVAVNVAEAPSTARKPFALTNAGGVIKHEKLAAEYAAIDATSAPTTPAVPHTTGTLTSVYTAQLIPCTQWMLGKTNETYRAHMGVCLVPSRPAAVPRPVGPSLGLRSLAV